MKRIFLLLALFPILLRADWDQLFSEAVGKMNTGNGSVKILPEYSVVNSRKYPLIFYLICNNRRRFKNLLSRF